MKKINVLIVEDHDLLASGIESKLKEKGKYHFQTKVVTNAELGRKCLKNGLFDLVLLDLVLKSENKGNKALGGEELLKEVGKMPIPPKVIVISQIDALDMLDYVVNHLFADGYILKSRRSLTEILPAIELVLNGQQYFSPSVLSSLKITTDLLELDRANRLIIKFLSQGLKHAEIEESLKDCQINMTVSAIEKRIKHLKDIFGAKTSAHLIALAFQKGVLESPKN